MKINVREESLISAKTRAWDQDMVKKWMDSCISDLTEEQVEWAANYLSVVAEARMREKEMYDKIQNDADHDCHHSKYGEDGCDCDMPRK